MENHVLEHLFNRLVKTYGAPPMREGQDAASMREVWVRRYKGYNASELKIMFNETVLRFTPTQRKPFPDFNDVDETTKGLRPSVQKKVEPSDSKRRLSQEEMDQAEEARKIGNEILAVGGDYAEKARTIAAMLYFRSDRWKKIKEDKRYFKSKSINGGGWMVAKTMIHNTIQSLMDQGLYNDLLYKLEKSEGIPMAEFNKTTQEWLAKECGSSSRAGMTINKGI